MEHLFPEDPSLVVAASSSLLSYATFMPYLRRVILDQCGMVIGIDPLDTNSDYKDWEDLRPSFARPAKRVTECKIGFSNEASATSRILDFFASLHLAFTA